MQTPQRNPPYDPRADLELSRLLHSTGRSCRRSCHTDSEESKQLRHIANTCATVLQEKTQSARFLPNSYAGRISTTTTNASDVLADALNSRFAPSEICELARSEDVIVRALANEALSQFPTSVREIVERSGGFRDCAMPCDVRRWSLVRMRRAKSSTHSIKWKSFSRRGSLHPAKRYRQAASSER